MDRGLARIECDIKQEVEVRPHKVKKYLLESFPLPGTSADLRRQFTTQPATEMVLQVFQNAEDIFVNKLKKCVQDFLGQVKGDTLARKLFQLALCCGSLETPRDLVVKEKPAAFLGNISTPDTRPPLLPGKAVAEHLVRLLSHASKMAEPLGLPALSRVEKQLAELLTRATSPAWASAPSWTSSIATPRCVRGVREPTRLQLVRGSTANSSPGDRGEN
ncbi:uncharacterized protein LOC142924848 [Petromyzon marinus]|uniref:uncharacterized protein LOC142924848 n=1 Tax=Petromyzon marinus TaxID=7757 RepID=UPI003F6E4C0E